MIEARPYDVFFPGCPSRRVFEAVFSRWGILVLTRMSPEPIRFGALREGVGGISDRLLTQTLRILVEEGLAVREAWPEKPPRVEYHLTPAGQQLSEDLKGLVNHLYSHLESSKTESVG